MCIPELISILTITMLVGFNLGMAVGQIIHNEPCKWQLIAALANFALLIVSFVMYNIKGV